MSRRYKSFYFYKTDFDSSFSDEVFKSFIYASMLKKYMGKKISVRISEDDEDADEIISKLGDKIDIDGDEGYEFDSKDFARMSTPVLLIIVSQELKNMDDEVVRKRVEEHNVTQEEIEMIKNYPESEIPRGKMDEIIEDIEEGFL